jgi:hypothetical protein
MSRKRKSEPDKFLYVRCPYCKVIGMYVTNRTVISCRIRYCIGVMIIPRDEVTKEDYWRLWG